MAVRSYFSYKLLAYLAGVSRFPYKRPMEGLYIYRFHAVSFSAFNVWIRFLVQGGRQIVIPIFIA